MIVPEIKDEYDFTNFQMLSCSDNKFNLLQALIDIANEMKIVKKKEYKQKSCLFKLSVSNWSLLILIMLAQGSTTGVWLYSFIYVVIAIIA